MIDVQVTKCNDNKERGDEEAVDEKKTLEENLDEPHDQDRASTILVDNAHERGEPCNEAEEGVRGRAEDSSHHEVELAAEVKEQEQQSAGDEKVEHG